jgi:hypothetical protein
MLRLKPLLNEKGNLKEDWKEEKEKKERKQKNVLFGWLLFIFLSFLLGNNTKQCLLLISLQQPQPS